MIFLHWSFNRQKFVEKSTSMVRHAAICVYLLFVASNASKPENLAKTYPRLYHELRSSARGTATESTKNRRWDSCTRLHLWKSEYLWAPSFLPSSGTPVITCWTLICGAFLTDSPCALPIMTCAAKIWIWIRSANVQHDPVWRRSLQIGKQSQSRLVYDKWRSGRSCTCPESNKWGVTLGQLCSNKAQSLSTDGQPQKKR